MKPIYRPPHRVYTTTKEEAFSAPLAFVNIGEFYDGHNAECYSSFRELHYLTVLCRSQRARKYFRRCFRHTATSWPRCLRPQQYQRLPFVIGYDFTDLPNLFLAFRQLVLSEESKPTFEEWKKKAWNKYKRDPFLASKIMPRGDIEVQSSFVSSTP